MASLEHLRDRIRPTTESQHGHLIQPAKARALPDSPTHLSSPRMRRVESSPPIIMGTPSPPLFPNNGTLTVRKRRQDRPATIHFASQTVLSEDEGSSRNVLTDAPHLNGPGESEGVLLEKSGSRSKLSMFVSGKSSTGSAISEVTDKVHLRQQENAPIYFPQLTPQDLPGGGLQRRDSGKRKALARMIDGAKSKYPRISQRSFTSGGLLRRTSSKSVPSQHAWTKSWDAKDAAENIRLSLDTTLVDQSLERTRSTAAGLPMAENMADQGIFDDPTFSFATSDLLSDTRVRQPFDTVPTVSRKDHAILTVQLNVLPGIDELPADEEDTFWVGIEAEAVTHYPSSRDQAFSRPYAPSPYGEVTDVVLTVSACTGCVVQKLVGQSNVPALRAYESSINLMVKVKVDQFPLEIRPSSSPENRAINADNAFHDLEALLGESLVPILTIECRYRNSLLPRASEIVALEDCFIRRTNYDAVWKLPSPENAAVRAPSQDGLHAKLILCLADEMSTDEALEELSNTFPDHDQCECPLYLEKMKRYLEDRINVQNADGDRDLRYTFATPSPPKPNISRFSFETPKFQSKERSNAFKNYPAHAILPLSGLKSAGITRGQSFDETTDRAQEIWRHMRNKSRGEDRPFRSTADPLKDWDDLERPLWEIRRQALLNKRSVGADTLKSLAVSTRGFGEGMHAPWM